MNNRTILPEYNRESPDCICLRLCSGDDVKTDIWVKRNLLASRIDYFNELFTTTDNNIVDLTNKFTLGELTALLRVADDESHELTFTETKNYLSAAEKCNDSKHIEFANSRISRMRLTFFHSVLIADYTGIQTMLKSGVDINATFDDNVCETMFNPLGAVVSPSDTLLMYAVKNKHTKLARLFLRNGADTSIVCNGYTPLMKAAESLDTDMVKLLLAKAVPSSEALLCVFIGEKDLFTKKDWARIDVINAATIIVKLLLDCGNACSPASILKELARRNVPQRARDLFSKIMNEHLATELRKNAQAGDAALARFFGGLAGANKATNDSENLPSPRTRK